MSDDDTTATGPSDRLDLWSAIDALWARLDGNRPPPATKRPRCYGC